MRRRPTRTIERSAIRSLNVVGVREMEAEELRRACLWSVAMVMGGVYYGGGLELL